MEDYFLSISSEYIRPHRLYSLDIVSEAPSQVPGRDEVWYLDMSILADTTSQFIPQYDDLSVNALDEGLISMPDFPSKFYSVMKDLDVGILKYSGPTTGVGGIMNEVYDAERPSAFSMFEQFSQKDISFNRVSKRINKVIYPSITRTYSGHKRSFR